MRENRDFVVPVNILAREKKKLNKKKKNIYIYSLRLRTPRFLGPHDTL